MIWVRIYISLNPDKKIPLANQGPDSPKECCWMRHNYHCVR
ncbi:hypothetical protein LEP1GSC005_2149 [Leptospira santarosai str. ST188]|uniref:Uncharacterized protein n=1 Tax=Leptospira santarosai serovar Shermani str. LT 821 TaxID=758847 RepID=A0A097ET39_9LEPT|nr:hypothetical protein LSS_23165 [Leptospira santarosai serovar Shermani str. LT 821]EKR90652.1 hypothetical protein LEP1GSC163_1300 [Leptospira santarosai str. CBC379]EMF90909.1 hypothetical protein LEP1GSC005_2149 [Leptospira santarosai str. ST188]EPG80690.1 hypothetical protein LEP1GSC048_1345 [Leptospira santarosai serovar Shermani str. 1342KT]